MKQERTRSRRLILSAGLLLGLVLGAAAAGATEGIIRDEPVSPLPPPAALDPRKVALGERLFADRRLSHDNSRACLSCHDVRTNGADAKRFDQAADKTTLTLNTNTVFNAALSFRLGWAGQFQTLEEHAARSLTSSNFMATTIGEVLDKLKDDPELSDEATAAYGRPLDWASLLDAIATYERSLVTPGSRFDRWLEGDDTALTPQELNGYRDFKSLGCVSCHQGVNIGGNLFERHGIFHQLGAREPEILRVPSLRNVATSPPYFHDGSAPTLDDAVRQMGYAQLNQTLTNDQVRDIVAYLQTLTGNYRDRPVTAPQAPSP